MSPGTLYSYSGADSIPIALTWVDEWTFYRRRGHELTFLSSGVIYHRIYAPGELSALAESAGWVAEGVYAGLKLEPIEPASPGTRMFLVARRGETVRS